MEHNQRQAIARAIAAVVKTGARTGTVYLSPKETVRVSRKVYRYSGRPKFDRTGFEFTVTIGKPNNPQRRFIKSAKKAGEPFPIRKVQLAYLKGKR